MLTICTTCEGAGSYYLLSKKEKECETCNTTGLVELPDDTEEFESKLKKWYINLDEERSNLTDYKNDIENSLNRLENLANSLGEYVLD